MTDERTGPLNYLTEGEAKEFHKLFVISFAFFTVVAIIAHLLVWEWRPWFPGTPGYEATSSLTAPAGQTTVVQHS
jgi:light-harvesting complex 1 beta chain